MLMYAKYILYVCHLLVCFCKFILTYFHHVEIDVCSRVSYTQCSYSSTKIRVAYTKQLLTFVEVSMFVCRPENPILSEALAEVNIMDIQVCKQTY